MGKRILLIEDEQNIIAALSFILSRAGWDVKTHSNGADAMDAVRRHKPDAIILDVMLPAKSGLDILREIREDPQTATIPVMMLTAKSQSGDRELARIAGANHFMTKPFSNAEVLDAVHELAGK